MSLCKIDQSIDLLTAFQKRVDEINGDIGHVIFSGDKGIAAGFDGLCEMNTDEPVRISIFSSMGELKFDKTFHDSVFKYLNLLHVRQGFIWQELQLQRNRMLSELLRSKQVSLQVLLMT